MLTQHPYTPIVFQIIIIKRFFFENLSLSALASAAPLFISIF